MILGLDSSPEHLGNKWLNMVPFGDKLKLNTQAQAWKGILEVHGVLSSTAERIWGGFLYQSLW